MIESITFNNKKMKYFKFGKGHKVIAMIPGLSIKSVMESEEAVIKEYNILANDYTIYCFDRIESPNASYSIKDMAIDMIDVFDKLKLKDIYLLGASQGGMISFCIALLKPSLIKKIAVASTTPQISDDTKNIFVKFINMAKERKTEELVLSFSKYIYPNDVYLKFEDFLKDFSKNITEFELDKFIIFSKSLLNFDILSNMPKIKTPILDFHDKNDELINISIIDDLKKVMKNNNYSTYVYEGYSHALYDLAPDFKNILLEYFNK